MKIYIKTDSWTIEKIETEKAFYQGNDFVDYIKLYFDERLINCSPTISLLLASGRRFGPFYSNGTTGASSYENGCYAFLFVLNQEVLSCSGQIQITISINEFNDNGTLIGARTIGNVVNNVVKTTFYPGNKILIIGDDPEEVILDFKSNLDNLDKKMSTLQNVVTDLARFGRMLPKTYTNIENAYDDVMQYFYTNADNSVVVAFACNSKQFLAFSVSSIEASQFIMLDTNTKNFYVVSKTDDSYTTVNMLVTPNILTEVLVSNNSIIKKAYEDYTDAKVASCKTVAISESVAQSKKYVDGNFYTKKNIEDIKAGIDLEISNLKKADANNKDAAISESIDQAKKYANETFYSKEQTDKIHAISDANIEALNTKINDITDGAPEKFDTFKEIAEQIDKFNQEHKDINSLINSVETKCKEIDSSDVNYTMSSNTDVTATSKNVNSIVLSIPANIKHGFYSTFNFMIGTTIPKFTLLNNTNYELHYFKDGIAVDRLEFNDNSFARIFVDCDGAYIYVMVQELQMGA